MTHGKILMQKFSFHPGCRNQAFLAKDWVAAAQTLKNQVSRHLKCFWDCKFWQRGTIHAGTGKIAIFDRTADFWGLRCVATAKAVRTFLIAETLGVDCFSREDNSSFPSSDFHFSSISLPSVTSVTSVTQSVAELLPSVQFCSFTVKSDR
jgi:hypothetical protein